MGKREMLDSTLSVLFSRKWKHKHRDKLKQLLCQSIE